MIQQRREAGGEGRLGSRRSWLVAAALPLIRRLDQLWSCAAVADCVRRHPKPGRGNSGQRGCLLDE